MGWGEGHGPGGLVREKRLAEPAESKILLLHVQLPACLVRSLTS
jgi:hypothetical protein